MIKPASTATSGGSQRRGLCPCLDVPGSFNMMPIVLASLGAESHRHIVCRTAGCLASKRACCDGARSVPREVRGCGEGRRVFGHWTALRGAAERKSGAFAARRCVARCAPYPRPAPGSAGTDGTGRSASCSATVTEKEPREEAGDDGAAETIVPVVAACPPTSSTGKEISSCSNAERRPRPKGVVCRSPLLSRECRRSIEVDAADVGEGQNLAFAVCRDTRIRAVRGCLDDPLRRRDICH